MRGQALIAQPLDNLLQPLQARSRAHQHTSTSAESEIGLVMSKPTTITISYRAMLGRINRKLVREHRQIRADRRGGIVRHMLIDTKKHIVLETDVDLQKLSQRLRVLHSWEKAEL